MTIGHAILIVLTGITTAAALYRHRRFKGTTLESLTSLCVCILAAAAVIGLGPAFVSYIQFEAATTRTGGLAYRFLNEPAEMVSYYLWFVRIPGIFLASLCALVALRTQSGRSFFYGILMSLWFGTLLVEGVSIFFGGSERQLPSQSLGDLLQSAVFGAIGAIVGAVALYWLWRKILLRGSGGLFQSTARQDVGALLRKALVIPSAIIAFYFIHVYRLPIHVAFVSESWGGVEFTQLGGPFSGLRLRDVKEDKSITLFAYGERFGIHPPYRGHFQGATIKLSPYLRHTKVDALTATYSQRPIKLLDDFISALKLPAQPDPPGRVLSTEAEIRLPNFVNMIHVSAKRDGRTPNAELKIPVGAKVIVSRNARKSPPIWRQFEEERNSSVTSIFVNDPGFAVEIDAKNLIHLGLQRVHPNLRFPYEPATEEQARRFCAEPGTIVSGGELHPLSFCSGDGAEKVSFAGRFAEQVLLSIAADSKLRVSLIFNGVQEIEVEDGKFAFRIVATIQSKVSDLFIKWSKGKLDMGGSQREVRDTDFVFIGGHNLLVSDREDGQFDVIGESNYILVNGALVNKTALAYFSSEFYSALFGALFAFAFLNFKKIVRFIDRI